MITEVEILSDGSTRWLNGANGCCLGRHVIASLRSIWMVHRDAQGQVENGS